MYVSVYACLCLCVREREKMGTVYVCVSYNQLKYEHSNCRPKKGHFEEFILLKGRFMNWKLVFKK